MTTELKKSKKRELKKSTPEPKETVNPITAVSNKSRIDIIRCRMKEEMNSVFAYVKNNPGKHIVHIANGTNMSMRNATVRLKKLRDAGKIEFRGGKKTGGYYLTGDGG